MIEINKQSEMEKYYYEKTNTYVFKDDVMFKCNICTVSNIYACNINANDIDAFDIIAGDITAHDIKAWDINADCIIANNIIADYITSNGINSCNIKTDSNIIADDIHAGNIIADDIIAHNIIANNISYCAVCIARNSLKCKKIKGRYENPIHKCLDNDIEFINDDEKTFAINNENINYLIEQELTKLKKEVEMFKEINLSLEEFLKAISNIKRWF